MVQSNIRTLTLDRCWEEEAHVVQVYKPWPSIKWKTFEVLDIKETCCTKFKMLMHKLPKVATKHDKKYRCAIESFGTLEDKIRRKKKEIQIVFDLFSSWED